MAEPPQTTDPREVRKLLARLSELYDMHEHANPWYVFRQPHDYPDGTTHFTHVQCQMHDNDGTPLTVSVGSYLTPELAELMTLSHNHLRELIAWARRGLDVNGE